MTRLRALRRVLLAAAATAALAPAGGAFAQTAPSVLDGPPPAAGPQPLWVPDPEQVSEPAAPAPVPDVSDAATIDLGATTAGDAAQVAVAHWLAAGARAAGLPGELPVMAALVESGLRNLPYGDADSVGFFQMRLAVWDHGAYAGYLAQPELQLRWFVDHALAVRDARRAAGDATFGDDPAQWGEWIADTERPYAGYRGRYALRLDEARALLAQPASDVSPFQLGLTVGGPAAPAGDASGDALAARVLADPAITLDERASGDLATPGRVDPRISAVLLEAAALFPISLWVIETGHSYYTVHGSVSNHSFGRAVDIGSVDGKVVSPSNDAAHALALALGRLPEPLRPTEIGSPWAIDDPAYFTDAGHQDHLHVGFDDPPAPGDGAVATELEAYSAAVNAPVRRAAPRAEPRFQAGGGPRKGGDTGAEPSFQVAR
ncbi:MAG: hypothetical protein QOJ35_3065 [Solirubrobacteraceae bacterium]|jgi:hypothetical protein|nr:hypothetical protein [Solirubrobacteraceae bacterium]